ncbi:MAG: GAF domain-containing sensor histidine kinase, partial [Candidatus Binatia bacterium]
MRYTLIAATAYLLIVEQGFAPPPPVTILLVVGALASNVVLGRLPGRITRSSRFALAVVVGDTVWITAALVTSGKFSGEFFYLYFLVLLMAAIGENLQLVALGALAVCGAYLYLLMASGTWSLWSSPSLIRIPFLFAAAAFYGHLVDRARHERRRADRSTEELRAEAEVAAALVRVGRAMISSLDTPVILDRLCEVTTEVLACDRSRTFLLDHEAGVFVPLAAYGDAPEWWAGARLVRIPRAPLAALLASLESEDVAQVGGHAPAPLALGGDDQAIIAMALRRGNEVIGIHTASLGQGRPPFSPRQQQIARKLAQIASMSLANAKLVEELESANRIKSDFVASMSHELRTPLNLIIGYNELLIDGAFGPVPGEQREVLQRVAHSSRELLDMIQATLDLSRLESNRVALEAAAVDPGVILAELEAETRALRAACTLRFEWAADDDLPTLYTDAVKLKMVLKNLIGNAFKFTERGGIAVRASARADGVEFAVSDTGIGIAPADQGLIFEPFHQVARDRGRHRSGAGLGLYIARRLTEMLGGTIGLESVVDRGSTFRIWIAAVPPALVALEMGASPLPATDWRRAATG